MQKIITVITLILLLAIGIVIGVFGNKITKSINALNNAEKSPSQQQKQTTVIINDLLTTADLTIYVNQNPLLLDLTQNNTIISAKSLNTEFENILTYKTDDPELQIYVNDQMSIGSTPLKITKLDNNEYINIKIKKQHATRTYKLQTLPSSFPKISLTGKSPYPGDYYSDSFKDTSNDSFIYKMNNSGQLLFYLKETINDLGSVANFQKHKLSNGNILYSYFKPTNSTDTISVPGVTNGSIVILNSQYQPIRELQLKKTNLVPEGGAVENHDFILLDENHYILTAAPIRTRYIESAKNYITLRENYIQEIKDGKVVFEWLSSNHPIF